MGDVIGTEPAPQRRRRPRLPALPGGGRARRVVGAVAVLAVAVGVVAVSRAGLDRGTPAAGSTDPVPVQGAMLRVAAGQEVVYALIADCRRPDPCRVALVSSSSDGRRWRELPLPGGRPTEAAAAGWRLVVSGPEDQLAIVDPAAGTVAAGTGSFVRRRITAGPALARVPTGREPLAGLCPRPRCPRPAVEYLEPRTGMRRPLAGQPPFPPLALAVEAAQLWVAGTDPRTGRWSVAVSSDDGATWRAATVPAVAGADRYVPRVVPVPEQQSAYLLLETPGERLNGLARVWQVPDPRTRAAPRPVRPEQPMLQLGTAVGLRDGGLALAGGAPAVLAPDGVVDLLAVGDPNAPRPYPVGQLQRGPHGLFLADGASADGVGIVVSPTGDPDSWQQRLVRLPPR